jgi:cytochrome c oxidase subunit II
MAASEEDILRSELRWSMVVGGAVALITDLGTKVEAGGQVTTRIVATQFAFDPQCVVVPSNEPVTLRLTSPDVIHGILATGTNENTMVIPGYVSQVHTVFTKTGDLFDALP